MTTKGYTTQDLERLRRGEKEAFGSIYSRFIEFVRTLSDERLSKSQRRLSDKNDIAQSVFLNLYNYFEQDNEKKRKNTATRKNLEGLLRMMVKNTVKSQWRYSHRKKKNSGKVRGSSAIWSLNPGLSNATGSFDNLPDKKAITPDEQRSRFEDFTRLLNLLPEKGKYRDIALLQNDGISVKEISKLLGVSMTTVRNRQDRIKEIFKKEYDRLIKPIKD